MVSASFTRPRQGNAAMPLVLSSAWPAAARCFACLPACLANRLGVRRRGTLYSVHHAATRCGVWSYFVYGGGTAGPVSGAFMTSPPTAYCNCTLGYRSAGSRSTAADQVLACLHCCVYGLRVVTQILNVTAVVVIILLYTDKQ